MASEGFGDAVKAVVDVDKKIMAVDGELHADEEILLAEKEGSKRENMWGINIYPNKLGDEMIEFDSMINIKPFLAVSFITVRLRTLRVILTNLLSRPH